MFQNRQLKLIVATLLGLALALTLALAWALGAGYLHLAHDGGVPVSRAPGVVAAYIQPLD